MGVAAIGVLSRLFHIVNETGCRAGYTGTGTINNTNMQAKNVINTLLDHQFGRGRNLQEQSIIRFLIVVMVVLFDQQDLLFGDAEFPDRATELSTIAAIVLAAILLVSFSFRSPDSNPALISSLAVFDSALVSFGLYQIGEHGFIVYPIYFMIIFGYGARFGNRYLFLVAILSITFFAVATHLEPFWEGKAALRVSLMLGLFLVSMYSAMLMRRMRVAQLEAEQANRNKSEFVANIGHEFRTPLNAIIGYSEILAENAEEQGRNEDLADIKRVHQSGLHLLGLVDNLMDFSKIEAGKLELDEKQFNLGEMIDEVVATSSPLVQRKNNRLTIRAENVPNVVFGDPFRIKQCLFNLLSNAAKFTEGGEITFEVTSMRLDTVDGMAFVVTDTGMGIAGKSLKHLFIDYHQGDLRDSQFGGTGLGLSITRKLARMMGGDIYVESTVGKGSIFTLWLPIGSK